MKAMSDTTLLERLPGLLNHCNRLKSKKAKGNFLTSLQTAFPIGRKLLIKRLSGNVHSSNGAGAARHTERSLRRWRSRCIVQAA